MVVPILRIPGMHCSVYDPEGPPTPRQAGCGHAKKKVSALLLTRIVISCFIHRGILAFMTSPSLVYRHRLILRAFRSA